MSLPGEGAKADLSPGVIAGQIAPLWGRVLRMLRLAAKGPVGEEELAQERRGLSQTLTSLIALAGAHQHALARVEAERDAARAALAQHRRLIEEGPDGYLVTDPQGVIREANIAAAEMLQLPRRFLVGKPLSAFVVEGDLRAFRWRLNNVRTQQRGEWPLRLRPRHGQPFIAGLALGAMETPGEPVPNLRWFIRDISVRQRAEELATTVEFTREILESEQRARTEAERARQHLELLARVSGVLASSVDYPAALGGVTVMLPLLGDLLLVDLQEGDRLDPQVTAHVDPVVDERLRGLRPRPVALPPGHPVMEVCRTGRPLLVEEVADGWLAAFAGSPAAAEAWRGIRLVSAMIVPIMSHRRQYGALTFGFGLSERRYDAHALGLAADIGLRVALALDTANLVRELETEHRRKDEFLAMLAHELRNPLGAVTNALAALDQASPDDRMQLARILGRQSRHLAHLVNDLLDVSRIRFGLVALHRRRVDLREIVRNAVEVTRARKESASLSISAHLARAPVLVEADPDRLEQVLGNLLDNAVKYTPAGGAIDVSVETEGSHAVLHVRDSGVGIPLEFQPRVFDVFSRASIQGTQPGGGLGLGLSVVRELIAQHGGAVTVESRGLGQGADFVIRLPLAMGPDRAASPRPAPAGEPSRPLSVLVVEDNDDGRESLRMVLEQHGQRVRVARDGREALAEAQAELPEVALIDIGLPDTDGYEVARAIRALPGGAAARLIALTGFSAQREQSAAAGFDAHLLKPIAPEALLGVLAVGSESAAGESRRR
jgi:PAS domain S-box-containing protein